VRHDLGLGESGGERIECDRDEHAGALDTRLPMAHVRIGKNGVVDAPYTEGFRRLAAAVRAGRRTHDPVADLRRCAWRYRTFALENRTYYSVMFDRPVPDFEPSIDAKVVASRTLDSLAELVQRAIDAGALPAQDARQLAACLWSTNHGVISLELKRVGPPDIDWSKRYTQVVDAILIGLTQAPHARREHH
jgi:AcrR family transcriptional regulator